MKTFIIILIVVVILGGLAYYFASSYAGNNNSEPATNTEQNNQPSTNTKTISIINFAFNPSPITVSKGTTVEWTNNDSAPHDVTGTNNTLLKSERLSKGQKYSLTFTTAGEFDYFCSIHPSMKGKVIVE